MPAAGQCADLALVWMEPQPCQMQGREAGGDWCGARGAPHLLTPSLGAVGGVG